MTAQPVVDADSSLGFELDEMDGIDKLHHIVASPMVHFADKTEEIDDGVKKASTATNELYVGGVALPFVAVGNQTYVVSHVA